MSGNSPRYRPRSRSRSPSGEVNQGTIYVGGIDHGMDEKSLRDAFSHLGDVIETKICYDLETGRPRGFGFVKFASQAEADDAVLKMDGKMISGRYVRCNIAKYNRGRGRGRGEFQHFGGRLVSFADNHLDKKKLDSLLELEQPTWPAGTFLA